MADTLYISVLIASALIEVAFFSLISLSLYKLFINRHVSTKQVVSVFASLAIVNGTIGVVGYLDTSDDKQPISYVICYCLAIIGLGMVVAHITHNPEAK